MTEPETQKRLCRSETVYYSVSVTFR